MESIPENRSGGLAASWGDADEASLGFRTDGSGWVPSPRTPGEATDSWATDPLASFEVEQWGNGAVVVATGEIDLFTAPRLHEALLSASQSSARVVLDLTGVTFLDSSGLAVLIEALRSADQGQHAPPRLVGPRPTVRRVLDITRVSQMLLIHDTVAEALEQAG